MQAMNANYGVSDVLCNFAGQCTHQNDLHFLALDVILPELVDPESSKPLPWEGGQEGELVLTNLYKDSQPLLRFRTGDLVRLTATDICSCGRTAPRFRVIGRTDEMVVVRGVNAFPSSVSAAINQCAELNGEYRVRLRHPAPYDRLPLEAELEHGVVASDALTRILSHTLGEALRLTVELTLLPGGTLPRTEGKTRRLIKEYAQ
jgi:phenylacetate-CoA ligase